MAARVIDAPVCLALRRLAARLHCRTGAESLFAPPAAVISHPKSGRTWLRVMFAEAGIDRVCFSHAGASEEASLPSAAFGPIARLWHRKRILFLVRDPRDTVVSFYFQATRRSHVYSGPFTSFVRDPRFGLERVLRFNLLWLSQRELFPAFTMLSYEQLHRDPQAALRQSARFLFGHELNELDVRRAIEKSSFKALRAMELSGEGKRRWGIRLSPGDPADIDSFKTRRGIVGGWRDYFTLEDEAYAAELLEAYDYFTKLSAARDMIHAAVDLPTAA